MASPATDVRESLALSRTKGLSFPEAWSTATRDLDAAWSRALAATVAGWRSAYERMEPSEHERALEALRARAAA